MRTEAYRNEAIYQLTRLWRGRYMRKNNALLYVSGETGIRDVMFERYSKLSKKQCNRIIKVTKEKILKLNGSDLV